MAFGGTRTFHRLAVAIEDAGWEVRDCIMWVHGQGFPKSADVSKQIDKAAGAEREVVGIKFYPREGTTPVTKKATSIMQQGGGEKVGQNSNLITAPATPAAKQWEGWGTALKPAHEPVIVGYRPLTAEQFIGILAETIRSQLCQCLPAADAEKSFIATQAKSSEVARSVPENVKIYELENSGNVRFAARRFTYLSPESSEETGDSVPIPARESGSQSIALEIKTLLGRVDDFSNNLMDTFTSGTTASISVNTVLSWNVISDDLLSRANTFTTSTGVRLTTALRTLSLFLSQITSNDTGSLSLDLSPAMEPIILARKPLDGTVAENVLRHGTGGINVDGCRVGTDWSKESSVRLGHTDKSCNSDGVTGWGGNKMHAEPHPQGRWPANLIHDGSDEVVGLFPVTAPSKAGVRRNRSGMGIHDSEKGTFGKGDVFGGFNDNGSAARFFYCAKASPSERGKTNKHPTVKPLALMRYLITLGLPPGGTVLDPFCGSGTTALACKELGRNYICIEKELEYYQIACNRLEQPIEHIPDEPIEEIIDNSPLQLKLF